MQIKYSPFLMCSQETLLFWGVCGLCIINIAVPYTNTVEPAQSDRTRQIVPYQTVTCNLVRITSIGFVRVHDVIAAVTPENACSMTRGTPNKRAGWREGSSAE